MNYRARSKSTADEKDDEQRSASNSSDAGLDNGNCDDAEGQVSVIYDLVGRLQGNDECWDRY